MPLAAVAAITSLTSANVPSASGGQLAEVPHPDDHEPLGGNDDDVLAESCPSRRKQSRGMPCAIR